MVFTKNRFFVRGLKSSKPPDRGHNGFGCSLGYTQLEDKVHLKVTITNFAGTFFRNFGLNDVL